MAVVSVVACPGLHPPGFRQNGSKQPRNGRLAQRAGVPLARPQNDGLLALRIAQTQRASVGQLRAPQAPAGSATRVSPHQSHQSVRAIAGSFSPWLPPENKKAAILVGIAARLENRFGFTRLLRFFSYRASRQSVRSPLEVKERKAKANLQAKIIAPPSAELAGEQSLGKDPAGVNPQNAARDSHFPTATAAAG